MPELVSAFQETFASPCLRVPTHVVVSSVGFSAGGRAQNPRRQAVRDCVAGVQ